MHYISHSIPPPPPPPASIHTSTNVHTHTFQPCVSFSLGQWYEWWCPIPLSMYIISITQHTTVSLSFSLHLHIIYYNGPPCQTWRLSDILGDNFSFCKPVSLPIFLRRLFFFLTGQKAGLNSKKKNYFKEFTFWPVIDDFNGFPGIVSCDCSIKSSEFVGYLNTS